MCRTSPKTQRDLFQELQPKVFTHPAVAPCSADVSRTSLYIHGRRVDLVPGSGSAWSGGFPAVTALPAIPDTLDHKLNKARDISWKCPELTRPRRSLTSPDMTLQVVFEILPASPSFLTDLQVGLGRNLNMILGRKHLANSPQPCHRGLRRQNATP